MSFIIGWLIKKVGVSFLVTFLEAMYIVTVFAFFVFMMNTIIFVRTQIQLLFNQFSSSSPSFGGGIDLSHMYGYLNVIGFFDAFATAEPFISSAIIFLLVRLLWKITNQAYKEFLTSVYHVASIL